MKSWFSNHHTLEEWIEEQINHNNDNTFDDVYTVDDDEATVNEFIIFIWVICLCFCGICCCCCAFCCGQGAPIICTGLQAIILAIIILNWNFQHFPFMLLIFTALSLYLLFQSIERIRAREEQENLVYFSTIQNMQNEWTRPQTTMVSVQSTPIVQATETTPLRHSAQGRYASTTGGDGGSGGGGASEGESHYPIEPSAPPPQLYYHDETTSELVRYPDNATPTAPHIALQNTSIEYREQHL